MSLVVDRHQRAAFVGAEQVAVAGRIGAGHGDTKAIRQRAIRPTPAAVERDVLHAYHVVVANVDLRVTVSFEIAHFDVGNAADAGAVRIAVEPLEVGIEDVHLLPAAGRADEQPPPVAVGRRAEETDDSLFGLLRQFELVSVEHVAAHVQPDDLAPAVAGEDLGFALGIIDDQDVTGLLHRVAGPEPGELQGHRLAAGGDGGPRCFRSARLGTAAQLGLVLAQPGFVAALAIGDDGIAGQKFVESLRQFAGQLRVVADFVILHRAVGAEDEHVGDLLDAEGHLRKLLRIARDRNRQLQLRKGIEQSLVRECLALASQLVIEMGEVRGPDCWTASMLTARITTLSLLRYCR